MSSLNKVFLMGNLTRDPELRHTQSNVAFATFGIAVNSTVGKDADGNKRTEVLFVDVTAFGKLAEAIAQYCKKGSPLFIEGRLRLRTWEDKDGNKHSKHEVLLNTFQFIGGASGGDKKEELPEIPQSDVGEDDIPF